MSRNPLRSTCSQTAVFGTRTGAKRRLQGPIRSESDWGQISQLTLLQRLLPQNTQPFTREVSTNVRSMSRFRSLPTIWRHRKMMPGKRRRKGSCDPGLNRESRAQEMLGAAVCSGVTPPAPVAVLDWASLASQLPTASCLG